MIKQEPVYPPSRIEPIKKLEEAIKELGNSMDALSRTVNRFNETLVNRK
jgi:hypothetical protein